MSIQLPVASSGGPTTPACAMPTVTASHRVTLTYRDHSTSDHHVASNDRGLWKLATVASKAGAVSGHAVVLDPARADYTTLYRIGWTASMVTADECPHPRITCRCDHDAMRYDTSCATCGRNWSWTDIDIPAGVRSRAEREWQVHGL